MGNFTLTPLHSSFSIFYPLLGHNDVENYKKECAERDRAALWFRRTEAIIQHMEEEKKSEQGYELDQQNRALDAAACDDVKKYLKSCKKRNRLSLDTQ